MSSKGPINADEKLPWGWHFHPTGPELINNLKKKVNLQGKERRASEPEDISDVLREVDLSQVEPWEIKDVKENCPIRARHADENDQFFYAQKEQKYRHGKRSNRATKKGFWKATGRDKPIYGSFRAADKCRKLIGLRKALVFYNGRAPSGTKTDWILHEYRLEHGPDTAAKQDESPWVACHMFKKERNFPVDPHDDLQQQQQHTEWTDLDVNMESGYPNMYSHVGPSQQVTRACSTEQAAYMQYATPLQVRDELSLPPLEEDTPYPGQGPHSTANTQPLSYLGAGNLSSVNEEIPYAGQGPRPTENTHLLSRHLVQNLPSFNDSQIFLHELLYGPLEHQPQNLDTNDNLWVE